ncbi:MAG: FxsA family protein [Bacillus sp. (in: firmicutes)]
MRSFLLLFIVLPACELGLLIWTGNSIGILSTVLLIIATGIGGAYLAKYEGMKTIQKVQQEISMGLMPDEELVNGLCILLGGCLLLAPGFITDFAGLLLLLPGTRNIMKKPMKKALYKKAQRNTITIIQ